MLRRLGADPAPLTAPFRPEGGAYGHGRTMGHEHGHSHDHAHAHSHTHAHDHG
jgi:urease accessory protein